MVFRNTDSTRLLLAGQKIGPKQVPCPTADCRIPVLERCLFGPSGVGSAAVATGARMAATSIAANLDFCMGISASFISLLVEAAT